MTTSTTPALTVTTPAATDQKKAKFTLLFATDGSPMTETAFQEAVTMARYCKGRLVLTFYAFPEDAAVYGGQPCTTNEQWQAYGRRVIERLAERARAAGVPQVDVVLEHYQDEESLYELGGEVGANMTTLASHCFRLN